MRSRTRPTAPWRRRPAQDQGQAAADVAVDEARALGAARQGDLRAWAWLVGWNQELVFRSAYLTTSDTAMAEETTPHVFIHAYRSLHSLEPGAEFRPWLLRITDSSARTRLREMTQRLDAGVSESALLPRVAATPIRLAPGTPTPMPLEHEALIDAFLTLTLSERNVVAARYAFGLGRDAAAARMAVEPGAVDGLLAAAMSRLRSRAMNTLQSSVGPAPDEAQATRPITPVRVGALSSDQLGSMTMAAVISELRWTPDVSAVVCDRLAKQSAAYPEIRTRALGLVAAASGLSRQRASEQAQTRPPKRPRPSTFQPIAAILGASLVVGAFLYSGGLVGVGSDAPADVQVALRSLLDDATATTDRPAAIGAIGSSSGVTPPTSIASPMTSRLGVSLVDARRLDGGTLAGVVRVAWPTSIDADSTVSAELEWRARDSAWTRVAWAAKGDALLTTIKPGTPFRFRVRALDSAGNQLISEVSHVRLAVRRPGSDLLVRSRRGWDAMRGPSGRQRIVATRPGARVRTAFRGTDVAIVGPSGDRAAALAVRVDGGPWLRDRNRDSGSDTSVLFSEGLDLGEHSIDIRAGSDGLAVDAILILRSQAA